MVYRKRKYIKKGYNNKQEYDIPTVISFFIIAIGYYLKNFLETKPIISNIITIITIVGTPIIIYLIIKNIGKEKERYFR